MKRLALYAGLIALLQPGFAHAESEANEILQRILSGIITYELADTPRKHASIIVANQSRMTFVETVRSFGSDNKFQILIVPGPNTDQVTIQLSSDNIILIVDNPFQDASEYSIALYQQEGGTVTDPVVDNTGAS